ncbi:MAG TPA: hypothetical protein VL987_09655 [Cellvibrio sp.]|jgi:P pilus assembly chaperone PapD|nr:hypothetical protein [Cellvibrio sp.]
MLRKAGKEFLNGKIAIMMKTICPSATRVSRSRQILTSLLLLLGAVPAFAELMLYPTRVVIEGNQRTAQIQLINNGTESKTYRIAVVNRRMSETGGFVDIDEPLPGELFADHMLRFSPRQVTLAPGAGQTVRVMVRKPANLAEGEYRSHLLFSQQPEASGQNSVETRKEHDKGIGVVITPLIGASIPLIVRHGKLDAEVKLTHLELQQSRGQASFLALRLERSGERSVYGDLTVTFTPKGGSETVVARANGVAVYSPNPVRRARLALELPGEKPLANGSLRVTFQEQAEAGGKLLAEAVLQVN